MIRMLAVARPSAGVAFAAAAVAGLMDKAAALAEPTTPAQTVTRDNAAFVRALVYLLTFGGEASTGVRTDGLVSPASSGLARSVSLSARTLGSFADAVDAVFTPAGVDKFSGRCQCVFDATLSPLRGTGVADRTDRHSAALCAAVGDTTPVCIGVLLLARRWAKLRRVLGELTKSAVFASVAVLIARASSLVDSPAISSDSNNNSYHADRAAIVDAVLELLTRMLGGDDASAVVNVVRFMLRGQSPSTNLCAKAALCIIERNGLQLTGEVTQLLVEFASAAANIVVFASPGEPNNHVSNPEPATPPHAPPCSGQAAGRVRGPATALSRRAAASNDARGGEKSARKRRSPGSHAFSAKKWSRSEKNAADFFKLVHFL